MSSETLNNESPNPRVSFYDLRTLCEGAMGIDQTLSTLQLELHLLLQQTGGVSPELEELLAVLAGSELRHAIWMLIGVLMRRRQAAVPSMSEKIDALSRTSPEEDMHLHELSDVPG